MALAPSFAPSYNDWPDVNYAEKKNTMIKCTFMFLLGFLLIAPAIVGAVVEPPNGYRALKWGASPSANLKKFSGPTSDGTTLYIPAAGKAPPSMFESPVAEEMYSFSHGKLYGGSAWFDGIGVFKKVRAALIKMYGQPSFSNEGMNLWKWKWPGNKIEVHLSYQPKFSRTTVTFLNNAI